jgi:type I restriction enzyme, R subunit
VNVHIESVRDDVDTLVMDAQVLEGILKDSQPDKKAREIEIKIVARLRKHGNNPKFTALGARLEKVKERHEQGFLTSLEFLKVVLEIAKDVVEAEKTVSSVEERDSQPRMHSALGRVTAPPRSGLERSIPPQTRRAFRY